MSDVTDVVAMRNTIVKVMLWVFVAVIALCVANVIALEWMNRTVNPWYFEVLKLSVGSISAVLAWYVGVQGYERVRGVR